VAAWSLKLWQLMDAVLGWLQRKLWWLPDPPT